MSLRKGSFHSPRIKNVKRYKTLQKQNRYKKSKFSENVRYCSWKGKNGMYAADVVVSGVLCQRKVLAPYSAFVMRSPYHQPTGQSQAVQSMDL